MYVISGIFGVPAEKVAVAMVEAVNKLSKHQTSLEEVYLADLGAGVISYIQQDMTCSPNFTEMPYSGVSLDFTSTVPVCRPVCTAKTYMADSSLFSLASCFDEDVECCICMDKPGNPTALKQCGHVFCYDCINTAFSHKPVCPICGNVVGTVTGDQPADGKMSCLLYARPLEGFKECGTIVIKYHFPDGVQSVSCKLLL